MRIDADTGCLAAFSGKVNAGAVLSFLGKYCNAIVRLQTELGCLKLYVLLNLNIQWTLHEHLPFYLQVSLQKCSLRGTH